MITVDFNQAAWAKTLAEHVAMCRVSIAGAVTSGARVWLRAAVRLTVPSGAGAALNKTSNQKRLGESLVVMDVNRLFSDWGKLRQSLKSESIKRQADKAMADGKEDRLKNIFRTWDFKGVTARPSHELHKQNRGKRGHVVKGTRPYLVTGRGAIAQYTKQAMSQVGIAKSGWKRAAGPLKVKLPAWVMRHDGKGHFKGITNRDNPVIEFGNAVGFANKNAREDAVMKYSGQFAQRQMQKSLAVYFKSLQAGKASELRSKVQKDTFEAMEA